MLIEGVRVCDVCNEPIEMGARFITSIVPKERASILMSVISEMDDAPSLTTDPAGNVKLDVCLECKLNMGLTDEIVQ
jgi:hypothetical protein